ncbi:MAG: hypothetical protein HQL56_09595 [Magnetococcales bacterium]|nr:hypothetical protein [Magnetococcales bacterium]
MSHEPRPLFRSMVLVVFGGFMITAFTLIGVVDGADELIRQDVRLGPVLAAVRVLVPLFLTMAFIYFLASIRKCQACGKILFWRRSVAD